MITTEKERLFLGIDVGSVSTNLVLVDEDGILLDKLYLRTNGNPISVLNKGMKMLADRVNSNAVIQGVGTTGSGRQLASVIVGADIVKNEITAHAIAAQKIEADVKTIIEIGGQDSKIIIIRNGVVSDFAMNTICAAGTGSFLDRQAARLDIPIEDFGSYSLKSNSPTRIAGRCAVFAESDMIHKQQTGHKTEDIICGLCEALVRNYLTNVAKGKDILEPILFQGGVAANIGIISAFKKALNKEIIVPENYDVMGAYGSALLAKREMQKNNKKTNFLGFSNSSNSFESKSIDCNSCSNMCEVIEIYSNNIKIAVWGDRCGKWSSKLEKLEGAN